MPDPLLPPTDRWVKGAVFALVLLLAGLLAIYVVRFLLILLPVLLGAAFIVLGVWALVRVYQILFP